MLTIEKNKPERNMECKRRKSTECVWSSTPTSARTKHELHSKIPTNLVPVRIESFGTNTHSRKCTHPVLDSHRSFGLSTEGCLHRSWLHLTFVPRCELSCDVRSAGRSINSLETRDVPKLPPPKKNGCSVRTFAAVRRQKGPRPKCQEVSSPNHLSASIASISHNLAQGVESFLRLSPSLSFSSHLRPSKKNEAPFRPLAQEQGQGRHEALSYPPGLGERKHCPAGLRSGKGMGGVQGYCGRR